MQEGVTSGSHVLFGWNVLWVAAILFVATYVVIMSEKINRAIAALLGGGLMIILGVLNQEAAVRGVDFNVLGLLTGMMVLVAITRKTGVFQYVAIWSAKKVNARPIGILLMLSVVTAVFSALLDNVTTVLLIVPVTLLITEELEIDPYPILAAEIFSSNIGGTATLIGDPPNIMIGSAANLSFNDFLVNVAPITPLIFVFTIVPIAFLWRKRLVTTEALRERVLGFREHEAITDARLLKKCLFVLGLVFVGFLAHGALHLEPATVAMFGAALLLLLANVGRDAEEQSKAVHEAFAEAEWVTIFFFVGLFILVKGVEAAGLLDMLARGVLELTKGSLHVTTYAVLWVSALASGIVDNIPFVAAMIPVIHQMGPALGGPRNLEIVWWALSLGACLGGNGTLIGASANVVVAGFAERAEEPIRFIPFLKVSVPAMLLSIVISNGYLYLRYLH
ncbi:MAG TPA: ArsB/NhaD family transporter [Gemmatimonadota bacterium]|nr:ArsB/NhaD family transporter [Gemmatimonadota bacterium]